MMMVWDGEQIQLVQWHILEEPLGLDDFSEIASVTSSVAVHEEEGENSSRVDMDEDC